MKFTEVQLKGAYVIDLESFEDERGFFARSFCQNEFESKGLDPHLVQCNISFNKRKGTLRGMHFQSAPHREVRLVRCTQGSIYDVIIDLREKSETYKQWFAVELTAQNHRMLYVPKGFAHGFQSLQDNTEVFYQMSEFYHPKSGRGMRWDDPAFQIDWPLPAVNLSEKDQCYPDFGRQT
jgi:dTDP-4-dehydrorhamnose 3,5-epimerase